MYPILSPTNWLFYTTNAFIVYYIHIEEFNKKIRSSRAFFRACVFQKTANEISPGWSVKRNFPRIDQIGSIPVRGKATITRFVEISWCWWYPTKDLVEHRLFNASIFRQDYQIKRYHLDMVSDGEGRLGGARIGFIYGRQQSGWCDPWRIVGLILNRAQAAFHGGLWRNCWSSSELCLVYYYVAIVRFDTF